MRILFVAMIHSLHTARWITQLNGLGWDVHVFPINDGGLVNSLLADVTYHHNALFGRPSGTSGLARAPMPGAVRIVDYRFPLLGRGLPLGSVGRRAVKAVARRLGGCRNDSRARRLAYVIHRVRPDVIHSFELCGAGDLVARAKGYLRTEMPPWIASNWGSDLFFHGHFQDQRERLRRVLDQCDYYGCECRRDVALARKYGFKGEVAYVWPNAGGFDLAGACKLRQPGPTSARRLILLKGYQGRFGRALVGLRAIQLCAPVLRNYRIGIYLADPSVQIMGEYLVGTQGLAIETIAPCSHEEMLRLHGQARVSLGLSVSDGVSTSSLEAMVMGSFPIQSNTSCAGEWFRDGESGFLVPAEDPDVIAEAIQRAAEDDALVNRAAEINARMAAERLDYERIRSQVITMYQELSARRCPQDAGKINSTSLRAMK